MKTTLNMLIQIAATLGQVVNIINPALSEKNKYYIAGGLAGLQGLVGIIANYYNPDGTKATESWEKKKDENKTP